MHRTPDEYIDEKLATGSKFADIRYLFNIVAAQISQQNNCRFFDFDYFYNHRWSNRKPTPPNKRKVYRPENAGKKWSAEDDKILIHMYNSGATKREMCNRFERTERGLAARLVRLGIIEDREVFYKRK